MESIPVLHVTGRTLAVAYEKALVALYQRGTHFRTQYDKEGEPLSLDCTMSITIEEPLTDPMIHKAFPGGIPDLREYVYELQGLKDAWVKNMNDPTDTRWEYTYHSRLHRYGEWKELAESDGARVSRTAGPFRVDQIERVIQKLSAQPFTRQAQMITWMPQLDLDCFDPPCLQSLWYRIIEDEQGAQWLNCNVRFRSNDAWGASFMNMFGLIMFNQEVIAAGVEERSGKPVRLARMHWQADSYHIYGKDIERFKRGLYDRLAATAFADRVFNFHDPDIQEMYHECEPEILRKIAEFDARMAAR